MDRTPSHMRWIAALRVIAFAASCGLFGGTAFAQAVPRRFSLNWVRHPGAEGCASSQLLARAVEQQLGPILHGASDADLAIEGSVALAHAGRFEVRMRVLTPGGAVLGERAIQREARDCSELTSAIVLILLLTLEADPSDDFPTSLLTSMSAVEDPASTLLGGIETHAATTTEERAETNGDVPPPAPPHTAPVAPPQSATRRAEVSLHAGTALSAALLPRVAFGPQLTGQLLTPWSLTFALQAHYFAPTHVQSAAPAEAANIRLSAFQTALSGCVPVLSRSAFQLGACLGGVLGVRWVDASVLRNPATTRRVYGGPSAGLALRYDFSTRWFAALDIEGAVLFRRDRFTYRDSSDDSKRLYRPRPVAFWSSLGVGVRL